MQHSCPICGAVVSQEDSETCCACGTATSVGQPGSQAVGTRALRPPARRVRHKVPRPSHISVKEDRSSLRIRFCWIWRRFTGPATMCLVWNAFVVGYCWGALRAEEVRIMWLVLVWGIPFAAIGLLLIYGTLAGFLNRTVIKATSEVITVRHVPIPWFDNHRLAVDQIEGLYWHNRADTEEGKESSFYTISARTKEAVEVELVRDIDDSVQAQFITQELERWLKIGDGAVGRELR